MITIDNNNFMYKFTLISPTQNTIDNVHNILFLNKELRKFKRINLKSTTVNNNLLRRYPLFLREFKKNLSKFHGTNKILNLNFPPSTPSVVRDKYWFGWFWTAQDFNNDGYLDYLYTGTMKPNNTEITGETTGGACGGRK